MRIVVLVFLNLERLVFELELEGYALIDAHVFVNLAYSALELLFLFFTLIFFFDVVQVIFLHVFAGEVGYFFREPAALIDQGQRAKPILLSRSKVIRAKAGRYVHYTRTILDSYEIANNYFECIA